MIFDLDGTLVDTADEFVPVVQALRAEHGREAMDAERIRASVSNGASALVSLGWICRRRRRNSRSKRLRLLELYSEVLGTVASPYPGIQELLDAICRTRHRLGDRHQQAQGLHRATAARSWTCQPAPGSVVCPDDVTDRKPHPESLYLQLPHLDCSPLNSDLRWRSPAGYRGGRRAGMYTIAAAYGYIEAQDDPASWGANLQADCSSKTAGTDAGRRITGQQRTG